MDTNVRRRSVVHRDLGDRVPVPSRTASRPAPSTIANVGQHRLGIFRDQGLPRPRVVYRRDADPPARRVEVGPQEELVVADHAVRAGVLAAQHRHECQRTWTHFGQPQLVARVGPPGGGDEQPSAVPGDRDPEVRRPFGAFAEHQLVGVRGGADPVPVHPAVVDALVAGVVTW